MQKMVFTNPIYFLSEQIEKENSSHNLIIFAKIYKSNYSEKFIKPLSNVYIIQNRC